MKKQYIITLAVILALLISFFYFKKEEVYTSKDYSPSGKLLATNEYVIRNGETIMHGKFVNYNERGIKISEGQFVDGHIKGECRYYYDNGKIQIIQFKNGKITEESTFYNQDGLINKYIMCDNYGKSTFTISFDEKGVRQYNGYSSLEIYQYQFTHRKEFNIKTEQILKVGDILKYHYLIANIPNTKRTFKIENLSIDDAKVKRTIIKKEPTSIIVKEVLTKKGLNRIRAVTRYTFNDKVTPVKNDTVYFDVNVR